MNKKVKLILNIVMITIIPWIPFTIADAVYEYVSHNLGDICQSISMITIPIVIAIVGIAFFIFSKEPDKCKVSHLLVFSLSTLGVDVGLLFLIMFLVDQDMWIVKQGNYLLNGIEYPLFAIFLFMSYMIVILFMIIYSIVRAVRRRKAAQSK